VNSSVGDEIMTRRAKKLPLYLTIGRGTEISALQMLQMPWLRTFVEDNKRDFRFCAGRDVMIYIGPDAVIPELR
jgi:hypothetical protein